MTRTISPSYNRFKPERRMDPDGTDVKEASQPAFLAGAREDALGTPVSFLVCPPFSYRGNSSPQRLVQLSIQFYDDGGHLNSSQDTLETLDWEPVYKSLGRGGTKSCMHAMWWNADQTIPFHGRKNCPSAMSSEFGRLWAYRWSVHGIR